MAVAIKLNRAGIRELLRSTDVRRDLERRAHRIAAAAGPGHEVQSIIGHNRARATVRTITDRATIAEEHHQTLTNAIRAGR